jgi:hypothetical protein
MFIEHLAVSLDYQLNFMKISSEEMLEASARSFVMDYEMMEELMPTCTINT